MLTVIYDGNCAICNKTKTLISKLDHQQQVNFIDLHQTNYWREQFPTISVDDVMEMLHVIDNRQNIYVGFDAIRRLLRLYPLTFPIYALSYTPLIGRRLGIIVYRAIANNRYRLNRLLGDRSQVNNENCATVRCKLS